MINRILSTQQSILQSLYTKWYAQKMGVDPAHLKISGICTIHGEGHFEIGQNILIRSTASHQVELYCRKDATLCIEDSVFINQGVHIACCNKIVLGESCLLADEVLIMDSDFHGIAGASAKSMPVIIQRYAWIGARAIILKGVTIGEGAVVGAGAVVTHSVPERTLVVGNPARIIRQWDAS
jgi:acetyltransferase-like isoleucine patch superfamily enzyme